MARYELYLLDRFGRAIRRKDYNCSDDSGAMRQGQNLAQDHEVDIWKDGQHIGRVPAGKDKSEQHQGTVCRRISLF